MMHRHPNSVEKSARLKKIGLSAGTRFDSGRNPVNSNQYGFEQIDPQASEPRKTERRDGPVTVHHSEWHEDSQRTGSVLRSSSASQQTSKQTVPAPE